jgi:hypothetical protein
VLEIHVHARGAHAPVHAVLAANCKVAMESWEAGGNNGVVLVGSSQTKESRSGF